MIDSSDDAVVYEADVRFAPKRKGDFYLFQFSHNSSPFSTKKPCLGSIKAKPKSNQFEIELLMDTRSDTFDEDKGKRIAFNVDDNQKSNDDQQNNEKFFPNNLMNKQVLNSEKLTSTNFQFAIGYLKENLNEIKLIPIKNVIEFKPTFRYMDKIKIRTSNKNQEESDEEDEQELAPLTKTNQDQSTKKVTMRFEDENDKKKKVIKNLDDDEPENWIDVNYFDYGLPKFEAEKDVILYKMNQNNDSDDVDNGVILDDSKQFSYEEFASCNLNDSNNELKKPIQLEGGEIKIDLFNTLPFYQTSTLTLKDQIRSILCSSKVISFNKCVYLLELNLEKNRLSIQSSNLSTELDLELVLKYLQQYAQLVQGCWVVKSEIIYPKKNFNSSNSFDINSIPFTNISYDVLCKARDFVLYKFTKQPSLSRLELIEQIRVPSNIIAEILVQFSNFNKQTRLWDFVIERDQHFLDNYKEIVKKQEIAWDATSKMLFNFFDLLID